MLSRPGRTTDQFACGISTQRQWPRCFTTSNMVSYLDQFGKWMLWLRLTIFSELEQFGRTNTHTNWQLSLEHPTTRKISSGWVNTNRGSNRRLRKVQVISFYRKILHKNQLSWNHDFFLHKIAYHSACYYNKFVWFYGLVML